MTPVTPRDGVRRCAGRFGALVSLWLVASAAVTGCAPADDKSGPRTPAAGDESTVVVFAAASLKPAFTAIGEQFTTAHPGSQIEFSFAGSADLVTQLTQGAPADIFASADTTTMDRAATAGLLSGAPVDFAANTLEIVVAPGNPKGVTSVKDLAQPGLLVVTCAPQVPCGSATRTVQRAAGVALNPVSEESQVTDVLNKVRSGQADAGLVYVTDVIAAGDAVTGVAFPESAAAVNTYPVALLKDSPHPDLARTFIDLVTGAAGQQILAGFGFGKP
jgi:molybdate transport system substrate-binding protein